MKKAFFFFVLSFIYSAAMSQSLRLNVYGNYAFDDHVDSYYSNSSYYNGKVKGGFLWGAGAEYHFNETNSIELLYLRQDTKAPMDYYNIIPKHTDFDLAMNYILLGGTRNFVLQNKKLEPFAGLMAGIGIADLKNPDNNNSNSITKFAWGIRGGINLWGSDKVGVKLQAQLLSVPQSVGGGFYFGTGGAGAGISTYSSIYQFALGGGLVFKLGSMK